MTVPIIPSDELGERWKKSRPDVCNILACPGGFDN